MNGYKPMLSFKRIIPVICQRLGLTGNAYSSTRDLLPVALLFTALFCGGARAQGIDDLLPVTENYPPLNFEQGGKVRGIAADLLGEMLRQAGSRKTRADFQVWPWARAYQTSLTQKNVLIFAITRTEARENLFKWVGPIMPSKIALFAKKSRNIRIKDAAELLASDYRIGVVRDDIGEQRLQELGVKPERLHPNTSVQAVAKMLAADRVDMWAYGTHVVLWNMKELGIPSNDYEEVYTLVESQQYYALSKDVSDTVVKKLQDALNTLKTNGKLTEILARYR